MITISGKWFDGRTSAQIDAVLKVYGNGACHLEKAQSGDLLLKQSGFLPKVSQRLANTPRYLTFSQGGVFETGDNDGIDKILAMLNKGHWNSWVHVLESKMRYIIPAVALCILLAVCAVKFGVPATAKLISAHLPEVVYQKAGEQTLNILDKLIFEPSELDEELEQRIRYHLQSTIDDHPAQRITVLFRKGGRIGPNAFALPDGQIIFTDEMIKIAEHDDEIVSVLAHEIGHVVHRRGMRRVVQDSLLSFAILSLTGDASGVSELFLGLPAVLTELAYSRAFEREADQFALDYLKSRSIPVHYFADILTRISKIDNDTSQKEQSGKKWSNYLATHPPTQERVKAFSGERQLHR
jgi:Zn-dependent protease with chaperone function